MFKRLWKTRNIQARRLSGAAARTGNKNIKLIEKNVKRRIFKSAIKRRNINSASTNME